MSSTRPRARLLLTLLLPGALLASAGCSSPPWRQELIYKSAGIALYKERKVDEADEARTVPLGYAHPIALPIAKAQILLSRLAYVDKRLFTRDRAAYVFDDAREIPLLVEPLCVAAGELGPDERLRFFVARTSWSDALKGTAATSGVLFARRPGEVEVALDWILERMAVPDEGRLEEVTFRLDPTELTDASRLLSSEGLHAVTDPATGATYPRWVTARIDELKPFPPPPPKAAPQPQTPALLPAIARPPLEGEAPPAVASQAPPPPPPPAQPAAPPQPAATPGEAPKEPAGDASAHARYERVRQRVETLKRLRADGVISEEEYQEQLRRALEEP